MKISIDPVTRIEGHAKISIFLDENGDVRDAQFHVTQYRGFEKLCEGRPFTEMPRLMARTCGICPVSHLIAASKACDQIMAVRVPQAGINLRKMINFAQILQSHALSFFYLSAPDILFGFDADPALRNITGVAQQDKKLIQFGIELRKFGQQIIEKLGIKRVHPEYIIPGGVAYPINKEIANWIMENIDIHLEKVFYGISLFKSVIPNFKDEIEHLVNFDTYHMALYNESNLELYDGILRVVDSKGNLIFEEKAHYNYKNIIGEKVESFSYLKSPYLKSFGYPDGIYRVGPLSRLNIVKNIGTPLANKELSEYRKLLGDVCNAGFMNHYARLIEMIYCLEAIGKILKQDITYNVHVKAVASVNASEGVGISEAPIGTLIHHYQVDKNGLITNANLIIATGHNNLAMNRGVLQAAKRYVKKDDIKEGFLNRVEGLIRSFDPCLSCSTHAIGKIPFEIKVYDNNGIMIRKLIK
ncbi:MAG: Ni/Fe hydrogenase subunit alpha [Deferribacterales bacterium]